MKKLYSLFAIICFAGTVNAQIINFPDANFKAKLLSADVTNDTAVNFSDANFKLDANSNGEIEVAEALLVKNLEISDADIADLTGINAFSNMVSLDCTGNLLTSFDQSNSLPSLLVLDCGSNLITSMNFSNLSQLQELFCWGNLITTLDVSSLSNLIKLYCDDNGMTSLNLTGLTNITYLHCYANELTSIDLSTLTNLRGLECRNNQLTSLNFTSSVLENLTCQNNQITSLNLSNLPVLHTINCNNNLITSLDVSQLTSLSAFHCSENLLTTIDVSNLYNLTNFNFSTNPQLTSVIMKSGIQYTFLALGGNPNLQYICADPSQYAQIQGQLNGWGMTGVQLNSYCNFHPGGTYYTLQGGTTIDYNNNGCDASDTSYQNLKFLITNGTQYTQLIANNSGNYFMPVQAGTYTLTPFFENASYYNVSPASLTVTFPAATNPVIQNFCITPNGIHNDLEVSIVPLHAARPGFDANYKIVYKNKGNQVQSGSITLSFNDAIMDYVTSNPLYSSQVANSLTWNFTNMAPFETRQVLTTFNVNSPMETPAVNSGDILNYVATISGAADETPTDNNAVFNQNVVNSLDPNDKTCLEGATITPAMVGEYLHYVIRFENTGTFPAENIVVTDFIDITKFSILSLTPTSSSHPFVTRITDNNKVEFIFEGINLPFDDANNDGYLAFKIKTHQGLPVGTVLSNLANIYFDYNFPVVTNTTNTIIQSLANPDFAFETYFSIAPNPVKGVLNLQAKDVAVSSVSIYNTLGQLVQVITNPISGIDVSGLKTGNYFIKINSDKGSSVSKFIKE